MIELAFNSDLKLTKWLKNNYDGSKQFAKPISVPCYKEEKFNKVLSSTGEEIVSKSNYFTIEKVTTNDLIDGEQVLSVEYFSMLGCSYYRSYT
jgi:hypothetical protein